MNAPSDTNPTMAAKQIELLRAAGPARRAAIAAAMTSDIIRASRSAIQCRHHEWSTLEVNLFWAEVHYGKELADRIREYLATQVK